MFRVLRRAMSLVRENKDIVVHHLLFLETSHRADVVGFHIVGDLSEPLEPHLIFRFGRVFNEDRIAKLRKQV